MAGIKKKAISKDKKLSGLKEQLMLNQSELKTIARQILKAKNLSEQRYLKKRQKELELQVKRLNSQIKDL